MSVFSKFIGACLVAIGTLSVPAAEATDVSHAVSRSHYTAPFAADGVEVDGISLDAAWEKADWRAINYKWLGPDYSETDFSGRFKVVWTAEKVYLLVEIVDDILYDAHRDSLTQYWDDDCLEVFLDEDYSGGDHQFNHNAFAYHFSLDNQAIDIGTDQKARNYSHHVESAWRQHQDIISWEVGISLYDDTYVDDSVENTPVTLLAGKIIGLMVAYCDNDGSELRENFIGSESVPSGPKDRGWIDAGLFGEVMLDE